MGGNESSESLGGRVSRARRERRLSQRQVAAKAGLGRDAVRRLEGGKSKAHKATLMAVAQALDLSYSELVGEHPQYSFAQAIPSPPHDKDSEKEESAEYRTERPLASQAKEPVTRRGAGYVHIYVGDRSWEEVVDELREWYELIQVARAWNPEPEVPADESTEKEPKPEEGS